MIARRLRAYAPAIVLLIFAALEPVTDSTPPVVVARLLVLAVALWLSIRESRRDSRPGRRRAR